jgi:hypothetical protein
VSVTAPVVVAVGTAQASTGPVGPALPSGYRPGDIAWLIQECEAGGSTSAPTGWTEVTNSPQDTGAVPTSNTRLAVYWRRAASSNEPAPFLADPGDHQYAVIVVTRGHPNVGNPWDVTAGDADATEQTSVSVPGATTTGANRLVLLIVARGDDSSAAHFSGFTNSDLTELTEIHDGGSTAGNGGGLGIATGLKASAGAYGTTTATSSVATAQARMSIALRPITQGFSHTDVLLAVRNVLLTFAGPTTGSTTLAATATGYSRASGSFVDDGFVIGMEITPSGFSTNTVDVLTGVTALTLTTKNARSVETSASGRTISVALPSARSWENVALTPTAGVPYITEEYVPGPSEKISMGPLGETEALPLYVVKVFVPSNTGRAAASKYADALLNLFASGTGIGVSGATVHVRSDPGPFAGQLIQTDDGWAVVPVTIPLRYRVANAA